MGWREWARESTAASALIRIVDALLAPMLLIGLLAARLMRTLGIQRTPVARMITDLVRVLPVHDHYYQPLVCPTRHLAPVPPARALPGFTLDLDGQRVLLDQLAVYAGEFRELARSGLYDPTNRFYGPTDASVLYAVLRHIGPARLVEVGAGHSTRVSSAALARNRVEGRSAKHVCIEPYENPWLVELDVEVDRRRVEDISAVEIAALSAGDVLFIDSSHVIRPEGDVLHLFLEVIPRLNEGVFIHIHDVFTPDDYPREWLIERRRLWNEQYLLEAMLSAGGRFEPYLAVHALGIGHPDALARLGGADAGGSFWVRVGS